MPGEDNGGRSDRSPAGPILYDDSSRPGAREAGDHERTGGFTLARSESWALPRMANSLPTWVMPDHLTALGLLASTLAIGLGLGFSPYMLLSVGLSIFIGYLLLSINVYLKTHVFGEFRLGHGMVGPTEVLLLLILFTRSAGNLRELARLEPPGVRRD